VIALVLRLVLSLALVAGALWMAARVAKKRGIGGVGGGMIEVISRQRLGKTSTVNLIRVADVVLVVGATEEQVTLLAEVDADAVDAALAERVAERGAAPVAAETPPGDAGTEELTAVAAGAHAVPLRRPAVRPRPPAGRQQAGGLSGSVFDKQGWGTVVDQLRERTVRRP
jgi:flagellar protein FliO/FliZ